MADNCRMRIFRGFDFGVYANGKGRLCMLAAGQKSLEMRASSRVLSFSPF
jgi:hypothetical protein